MTSPTAPTPRRSYHHGDLRRALIDATLELVEERGVNGFTVTEAARHAGVSVAAPYRHFADKDALVSAAATAGFDALNDVLTRGDQDPPDGAGEALAVLAVRYVEFAVDSPAQFTLMFAARIDKSRVPDLQAAVDRTQAVLAAAVGALPSSAKPPAEVATEAWSLAHGVATMAVSGLLGRHVDVASVAASTVRNLVGTWLLGLAAAAVSSADPATGSNPPTGVAAR